MVWLSKPVNLSTSTGHDSLKRLACENKRAPSDAIIKKARTKVIIIATTLFILIRTRKFTTGWSKIAIRIAKITGTIIP